MLPKSRRISRSEVKTFGRNTALHGRFLVLFLYKKADQGPSQFSFSVSKKVAKSAVVRNKLRRRGYAAIASIISILKPGFYYIFSFKNGSTTLTAQDISKEIQEIVPVILSALVTTASL